jgi:hypothetical protein
VVGVYCVNFITVVGPVWIMFIYSVYLIIVVNSALVGTYSVNSIIYRIGACVSRPILEEAAILQLVLGCTNKDGVQYC